ncbi:MAG: GNAT family N-acetyltransferase [Pseudorhodobacter sp.]|nr:GNAT family N-acetyltransferase [Pseudorhodobacter sp.]
MKIRDTTSDDHAAWLHLWQGFLAFHDTDLAPAITAHTWARLIDPANPMQMRLAEGDGRVVGFAIHQHHPSTWVLGDDCYLEDLYVEPDQRGKGIGRALMEDLQQLAKSKGWNRLYWHSDGDNVAARRLYDSFTLADGFIRYRFALK